MKSSFHNVTQLVRLRTKTTEFFFLQIRCHGYVFTESLSSNNRLFWLRYSGFRASCHNILSLPCFRLLSGNGFPRFCVPRYYWPATVSQLTRHYYATNYNNWGSSASHVSQEPQNRAALYACRLSLHYFVEFRLGLCSDRLTCASILQLKPLRGLGRKYRSSVDLGDVVSPVQF
jgi:hypothetical protein